MERFTDPVFHLNAGGATYRVSRTFRHTMYMGVESTRRYLGVTRLDRFQHGVVNEHVLVLGLHHVVALRAQTRHVTVDINGAHVFEPLQHRVDHDERPRATDSRTNGRNKSQPTALFFDYTTPSWSMQ